MLCKNCGREIPDNAQRCNFCGAPAPAPEKKKSRLPLILTAVFFGIAIIAVIVLVILNIVRYKDGGTEDADIITTAAETTAEAPAAAEPGTETPAPGTDDEMSPEEMVMLYDILDIFSNLEDFTENADIITDTSLITGDWTAYEMKEDSDELTSYSLSITENDGNLTFVFDADKIIDFDNRVIRDSGSKFMFKDGPMDEEGNITVYGDIGSDSYECFSFGEYNGEITGIFINVENDEPKEVYVISK